MTVRIGCLVAVLLAAAPARADRPDLRVDVEPAAYVLRGFSAHLRMALPPAPRNVIGVGAYGFDLPHPSGRPRRRQPRRALGGPAARLPLRLIGSTALMLEAGLHRGTRDSDVLETANLDRQAKDRLIGLAGPGTLIAVRRGLYIDIVTSNVPFLPQVPRWHAMARLNASLQNLEISVLDVLDVVISKLARFSANDRSDIEAMIDRGRVDHAALIARFHAAIDYNGGDARATDFPRYVSNLHQVERDFFGEPGTEIELPGWI